MAASKQNTAEHVIEKGELQSVTEGYPLNNMGTTEEQPGIDKGDISVTKESSLPELQTSEDSSHIRRTTGDYLAGSTLLLPSTVEETTDDTEDQSLQGPAGTSIQSQTESEPIETLGLSCPTLMERSYAALLADDNVALERISLSQRERRKSTESLVADVIGEWLKDNGGKDISMHAVASTDQVSEPQPSGTDLCQPLLPPTEDCGLHSTTMKGAGKNPPVMGEVGRALRKEYGAFLENISLEQKRSSSVAECIPGSGARIHKTANSNPAGSTMVYIRNEHDLFFSYEEVGRYGNMLGGTVLHRSFKDETLQLVPIDPELSQSQLLKRRLLCYDRRKRYRADAGAVSLDLEVKELRVKSQILGRENEAGNQGNQSPPVDRDSSSISASEERHVKVDEGGSAEDEDGEYELEDVDNEDEEDNNAEASRASPESFPEGSLPSESSYASEEDDDVPPPMPLYSDEAFDGHLNELDKIYEYIKVHDRLLKRLVRQIFDDNLTLSRFDGNAYTSLGAKRLYVRMEENSGDVKSLLVKLDEKMSLFAEKQRELVKLIVGVVNPHTGEFWSKFKDTGMRAGIPVDQPRLSIAPFFA